MRPFDGFRARKVLEITAHYDAFVGVGFPVTLDGHAETLQVARDVDKTNWLTVYGICLEAVGAGLGDLPLTIFTTSDTAYTLTFSQCAWMLGEMRNWGIAADGNWRRLKKLARDAAERADLDLIDIAEGYP